ncbi:MAG: ATP-dependent DNA helicase RecG [Polyangiales bacterium]
MTVDELVLGLQSCLSETVPNESARRALGAALQAFAPEDSSFGELAIALERGGSRREIAMSAATAMRLLLAARARTAAEQPEPPKPAPADRRRARLERGQARALAARREELPVPQQPVEDLPGVGRASGLFLRARGLRTLGDLAWLLPLGYHDERDVVEIADLRVGERQVTHGQVVSAQQRPAGRGRRLAEVILEQPPGSPGAGARLRLIWFRAPPGLLARFRPGARFRVAGVVERFSAMPSMSHPQTEVLSAAGQAQAAGIVPRYAAVPGVPPKVLARVVRAALERCAPHLPNAIPRSLRQQQELVDIGDALRALHAPPRELDAEALARWNQQRTEHHARLAFEEFFLLELALHRRRAEEQGVLAEPLDPPAAPLQRAQAALGFSLTAAQARAVGEIAQDMRRARPMRRLLQGDVGSGKTAVALLAAAHAVAAGAQTALMAPTEVLAEQHFRSIATLAQALGLRAALVLGGERASHRRKTRKALEEGLIDLVVGTHALLSEGVRFSRLRLVVVDEQHRFGVAQRLRLVDKAQGLAPHLLVMTATPIPRSLTLALHGDLDASVLDEMPPGRVPPITRAYRSTERAEALRQLERGLAAGGRAFVVCPAIEPSEDSGSRCAIETHAELSESFAQFGVALLHGRLEPAARQEALERFGRGEARVLVSTTIVEVGLDVREANVMLIEQAERFGLAQLHQLRGRVGRGGQRSACLLIHDAASEEARERIRILCECADGFRIAEEDLRLRGPGELFGRKQSGLPGFRFGDLRRDQPLLKQAQVLARELIESDPGLEREEHTGARRALEALSEGERALVKEEAG